MTTAITRRGVVAALAAGAAVNIPAIAMTAAAIAPVATSAAQRDQELLDLGRRYEAALAIEDAADEACTAAGEALSAAQPAMPPVLRHRMDDHVLHQFPVLGGTDTICDDDPDHAAPDRGRPDPSGGDHHCMGLP